MKALTWSDEQNRIFDEFTHPNGHFVVDALAGTGKTTTAVEGGRRAPERQKVFFAFNKKIKDELAKRLVGSNMQAQTLHSAGLGCVTLQWGRLPIDDDRADRLTADVCHSSVPDMIRRMISKLHTKAREIQPHATNADELLDLAWRFECVPENGFQEAGYTVEFVARKAVEAMVLAASKKPAAGIDFADMIFLPVRNRWIVPKWDLVVVDEYQDMSYAQLELAVGLVKPSGRVCLIGDVHQAIYAFRGADTEVAESLKHRLKARVVPLTVTYRCGRKIVEIAQGFVPEYAAHESNPEGEILTIKIDDLEERIQHGDFLLSRFNAPLTKCAMALLRRGKRARIAGRDIGKSLSAIVSRLKPRSIEDFLEKLDQWVGREVARAEAARREARASQVRDQAQTLEALTDNCESVQDLYDRIAHLFTDDGLGSAGIITCSSVHKAKGLEAKRVFILRSTLKDHDQEERNIQYVAVTRAIETLVWVEGRV